MTRVRDDVAALLRAGATYNQVHTELGVGQATIAATRKAYNIPLPVGRRGHSRRGTEAAQVEARIAAMLRVGATYATIRTELHVSTTLIARVRRNHKIPTPSGRPSGRAVRTPEQTLAAYSRPAADGHTLWTGPLGRVGRPVIWMRNKAHNARAVAFRKHHGRDPVGRVTVACDEPRCIAGPHLADSTIRAAHRRADTVFEQIFGP
ncbi:hypothetical protein [Streptomyces stelliscabiei]|uniref:hypothetical protein n=1 Tax=Streptomyces stelliscabiei TaxID=146820 RepID=UPI0029BCE0CE|nr:hypothetical protein [Streptomyces stelliscabiei]MDX2551347.1 hypothetical protein [Streptomyces stelliscabiei]